MKIYLDNLTKLINQKVNFDDLSEKLFQLGHEHEFKDNILHLEITPNRGDCLSIKGISREISNFYNIEFMPQIFNDSIDNFDFDFTNNSEQDCPNISFLLIEISEVPNIYNDYLESYFKNLDIKKNNFFTDISNYLSYELGQPTHCYDFEKIGSKLVLEKHSTNSKFVTLTDKKIEISDSDLVFTNGNEVVNLAGVMGGKSTACDKNTKKVLIECAYFKPEAIIGKSTKYDLDSDAAYKFERGVDPLSIEHTLRRFIKIVEDHTKINNLAMTSRNYLDFKNHIIENDKSKVERILGINLDSQIYNNILKNLGFFVDKSIKVPSFRNDIDDLNHIAEEIGRVIGYNNLPAQKFKIPFKSKSQVNLEDRVRFFLASNGFNESISYPFTSNKTTKSIEIDNPLDSRKNFLRTNLVDSLTSKLEYNERRQKDSIRLFEISNLYESTDSDIPNESRNLGLIVSGRMGKNFRDFNNFMDSNYLSNVLARITDYDFHVEEISRENINSKNKSKIFFCEIPISNICKNLKVDVNNKLIEFNNINYTDISEYPSMNRDLSFLIKNESKIAQLEGAIYDFKDPILIESFGFDFYNDPKTNNIKIGFRFVFQSREKTLTDKEVDKVMGDIVESTLSLGDIEIPGIKHET